MATYRLRSPLDETPLRRRASGLVLALVINALVVLVLLGIGAIPLKLPRGGQAPLIVNLVQSSDRQSTASKARTEDRRTPRIEETRPIPKPRILLPAKPTIVPPRESPWLELSKAEMAAADIGRMPKGSGAGGSGPGDSEQVGRAPNGEVLYAAEWARHPTNAELGGYLPRNAPDGWGLVACRTIEGNRVEDCIELDQSPRGSHLARAVRQAAWQFRVRPPRKNGRPLIGSWVQIRIDYYSVART